MRLPARQTQTQATTSEVHCWFRTIHCPTQSLVSCPLCAGLRNGPGGMREALAIQCTLSMQHRQEYINDIKQQHHQIHQEQYIINLKECLPSSTQHKEQYIKHIGDQEGKHYTSTCQHTNTVDTKLSSEQSKQATEANIQSLCTVAVFVAVKTPPCWPRR